MTKPSDLKIYYKEPAIPGVRDTVLKGLTEHLHSTRPDLNFEFHSFEIPAYADDDDEAAVSSNSVSDGTSNDTANTEKPARKLIGALLGHTLMNMVYIDLLWIEPSLRKTGTGTALMKKAEELAVEQGFRTIFVDTLTFQGPDYYPKLGYEEMYRVKAFGEEGIERIYFKKEIWG